MTEREALKLALEALKQIDEAMPFPVAKLAQKVIKEALAQPEQDWIERERAVGYREGHMAALAQRTWVGLTDIDYAGLPLEQVGLVRWAEAKLKAKNT